MPRINYIIGVDEAGRGPLAGPVAVGAVLIPVRFDWGPWRGVRDSKQLTTLARERWFERLCEAQRLRQLRFAVSFTNASYIDRFGIVRATATALARAIVRLHAEPAQCLVLLDGLLCAPERFYFQKTIIRGDDLEPVISLASIAAKVLRDRKMRQLGTQYPEYEFETHKGYGTQKHYERIAAYGPCLLHRRSFLRVV